VVFHSFRSRGVLRVRVSIILQTRIAIPFVGLFLLAPAQSFLVQRLNVARYEVTESKGIPFSDFVSRSAFNMFSSVMYGESPRTTDSCAIDTKDLDFVKSSQATFNLTGRLLVNPLKKISGGKIYHSFKVNMDRTFAFGSDKTAGYIKQAMQERGGSEAVGEGAMEAGEGKAGSGGCPVTAVKDSLVGRLLNCGRLSAEDIRLFSGPMLMAGVNTTAYVMS
jgi:hypothetical protein